MKSKEPRYPLAPPMPRRRPEEPEPAAEAPVSSDSPYAERLHKVLAHAGVGSRRACETLIREGRVQVDGRVVREMGLRVDPARQRVLFDDKPVRLERRIAYALHKPPGVLCTNADELGRLRVIDLFRVVRQRLYPVGRLDKDSEGLIIVTNDGALALRLTHPRYGVAKTYEVWVRGRIEDEAVRRLREGIRLSEGVAQLEEVRVLARHPKGSRLRILAKEGRNREIRRVLAKVGHPVSRLVRVAIGGLELGDLGVGRYRPLGPEDLAALK